MSKEIVRRWLGEMKARDIARSDAKCAEILGVNKNTITKWRNSGAISKSTRLAMAAALEGMDPYE